MKLSSFCNADFHKAGQFFNQVLSINEDNHQGRLMRYIVDRMEGYFKKGNTVYPLLEMKWYSTGEFFGYLAELLAGSVTLEQAENSWNSTTEMGWLLYISGLLHQKQNNIDEAIACWQQSIHHSALDDWPLYLSFAALEQLQEKKNTTQDLMVERVRHDYKHHMHDKEGLKSRSKELMAAFENAGDDYGEKAALLQQLYELEPENKKYLAYSVMGFHAEAEGDRSFAMHCYREALATYFDEWPEYELAKVRYTRLRTNEN